MIYHGPRDVGMAGASERIGKGKHTDTYTEKLGSRGLGSLLEKPHHLEVQGICCKQLSLCVLGYYCTEINKEAGFIVHSCIKEAGLVYLRRATLCRGAVFRP